MIRLAIQLTDTNEESDFLAAASRIPEVKLVHLNEDPDAVVSDNSNTHNENKPGLLIRAEPPEGTKQIPAFPWRHSPQVRAIRESLEAGELGRPGLLRMSVWHPAPHRLCEAEWISAIDLVRWMMGGTLSHSHFTESKNANLMHFGFASGAMAMVDLTTSLREGEGYHSLYLIGSRGTAYADDHRNRNLFFEGGAPRASAPTLDKACIQPMLEGFIADIRSGEVGKKALRDYKEAKDLLKSHQRTP